MEKGWLDNDTFSFFVPAQVISKGNSSSKDTKRWIQGIASTDSRDIQGEIVDQHGIDFSYFLKYGYFNNDHKPGFKNKVGQPTECRLTKNGLWVKGFLFKNHEVSDEIWELLNSLSSSGANRKVGFSIQGKVKRREGTTIKECWIQDVAITPAPVNTTTWAEIAKSLSAQKWDFNKSVNDDDDDEKDEEESQKAQTSNTPLAVESLEGTHKEDRTSKALDFDEAVSFLQEEHSLPRDAAVAVAKAIYTVL